MSDTSASNPLRLDLCPACGYALEGLPEEGRCPECGVEYRPGLIVLHGFGGGISTGRARLAWTTAAVYVVIAILMVTSWHPPVASMCSTSCIPRTCCFGP